MIFKQTIPTFIFTKWLLHDRENKLLIGVAFAVIVISFSWLKILYPLPNFMPPDSVSYIEAATNNQFINFWAIGYSKFLRLVSCFSNSHFILIALQYYFIQISLIYFLFSIRYLFCPGIISFRLLFLLSIANPLWPHIANFVSSDCLFISLSLIWFTQLLWITFRINKRLLLGHSIILVLCFTVRYNSLVYPIISVITILLFTHLKHKAKLGAIVVALFPILIFIGCTQMEYYNKTKTVQFSAFAGWQLAANALYGYAYATPDDHSKLPFEFWKLHRLTNHHMDSLQHLTVRPDDEVAIYYLWNLKSPLVQYAERQEAKDSIKDYFVTWAKLAPMYKRYGWNLILRHQVPFTRHYLWPNFINYYVPPTKFMGFYNLGKDTVDGKIATWFEWKNNTVPTRTKNKQIWITKPFPIVMALTNVVFILSLLVFKQIREPIENGNIRRHILSCVFLTWLFNMVFSVFAAPIELRYQLFPFAFTFCFMWLLISYIVHLSFLNPSNRISIKNSSPSYS